MGFKYMEGLLLSDLLCLYRDTNETQYLQEIKNRMQFCDFNVKEINEFIRFEGEIIESRNYKHTKNILKKYWFIGNSDKANYFKDIYSYMYDPDSDNKKTILLSEALTIIDEAFFIAHSSQIKKYKAKDEILKLSIEKQYNWPYYEFKNRIEYICRCANKIFDGPKSALYNDKITHLYENEMQICLLRWGNIDLTSKHFIPYTDQYYDC